MPYIVIAKEKYRHLNAIQNKITEMDWMEAIEKTPNFFWYEDTEPGKEYYSNFPDSPKKIQALAEYDKKEKYYKLIAYFSEEYGIVSFDLSRITVSRLLIMYELASQLDALLLKGSKIIDMAFIENLRAK